MIKEIEVKSILSTNEHPEYWFGAKYTMNLYRGCEHRCIYCDSMSQCYRIDNFEDVLVKVNAIELLREELSKKRLKGIIGTGAMSDPYTFVEGKYKLTEKALKCISDFGFPVHMITKSDMVLRDKEILQQISRTHASVAFTITTVDDVLSAKVEPFAPSPTRRLKAMKELSAAGIITGVTMMPILPFIEDDEESIKAIVKKASENGASFIIGAFGVTLRDRQRDYYYKKLDENFPWLRDKYEEVYGETYSCSSPKSKRLYDVFKEECKRYHIISSMKHLPWNKEYEQLSFI